MEWAEWFRRYYYLQILVETDLHNSQVHAMWFERGVQRIDESQIVVDCVETVEICKRVVWYHLHLYNYSYCMCDSIQSRVYVAKEGR